MFVLNLKLDFKKVLFGCILVALLVATIIEFSNMNTDTVSSKNANAYDFILEDTNYIDILKTVHNNIDENVGKTIKLSGYVCRMPDFKENYFICGRDIIQNNENNIAGFLCYNDKSSSLLDNEWIEITGVISKGEYNGQMPIIKVGNIKKITAPANTYIEQKGSS